MLIENKRLVSIYYFLQFQGSSTNCFKDGHCRWKFSAWCPREHCQLSCCRMALSILESGQWWSQRPEWLCCRLWSFCVCTTCSRTCTSCSIGRCLEICPPFQTPCQIPRRLISSAAPSKSIAWRHPLSWNCSCMSSCPRATPAKPQSAWSQSLLFVGPLSANNENQMLKLSHSKSKKLTPQLSSLLISKISQFVTNDGQI